MAETEQAGDRLAALEARMCRLEDEVAIYRLLASYSPAVDSCDEDATTDLWAPDGGYDFGGTPLEGARNVGSLVHLDSHQEYVRKGCAHVMSLPLVSVDGDRAVATGYSRVYLYADDGWKVERVSANRWELVRAGDGWKVASRTNRLMDGSPAGRELLARGLHTDQEIPA
ncbi:nuclear transport factor 2 family protein [Aquamicrobium sp. LC103]|uniref:nuclear transport factor 2 family protein n=1 Tax=Aquamicrobium sp. LC103 TaxID=1120658 RepID=UPI00063E95AA|nr:nuclear transport factor 2 family protein [Aquamicrobium sp. LC103]TKT75752.1 nuclear transport factor 2 family protein [Aquamicrobium sp. LC103]